MPGRARSYSIFRGVSSSLSLCPLLAQLGHTLQFSGMLCKSGYTAAGLTHTDCHIITPAQCCPRKPQLHVLGLFLVLHCFHCRNSVLHAAITPRLDPSKMDVHPFQSQFRSSTALDHRWDCYTCCIHSLYWGQVGLDNNNHECPSNRAVHFSIECESSIWILRRARLISCYS